MFIVVGILVHTRLSTGEYYFLGCVILDFLPPASRSRTTTLGRLGLTVSGFITRISDSRQMFTLEVVRTDACHVHRHLPVQQLKVRKTSFAPAVQSPQTRGPRHPSSTKANRRWMYQCAFPLSRAISVGFRCEGLVSAVSRCKRESNFRNRIRKRKIHDPRKVSGESVSGDRISNSCVQYEWLCTTEIHDCISTVCPDRLAG